MRLRVYKRQYQMTDDRNRSNAKYGSDIAISHVTQTGYVSYVKFGQHEHYRKYCKHSLNTIWICSIKNKSKMFTDRSRYLVVKIECN